MAYEKKPLTGALFKNERRTRDAHPEYAGWIMDENGQEFWLSAWVKDGAKGKFFSLSLKPKQPAQTGNDDAQFGQARPPILRPSLKDELNDEVPF